MVYMDGDTKNAEFIKNIAYFCEKEPTLRLGQIYMNALASVDMALYEAITNTDYDCFYDDSNLYRFLNKIRSEWGIES